MLHQYEVGYTRCTNTVTSFAIAVISLHVGNVVVNVLLKVRHLSNTKNGMINLMLNGFMEKDLIIYFHRLNTKIVDNKYHPEKLLSIIYFDKNTAKSNFIF